MPNASRSGPVTAYTASRKYLRLSNKQADKVPHIRRVIRVRDLTRVRRSQRLMAKSAKFVDKNGPSINGTNPEGGENIDNILQEIHFLVQLYRILDVESSSQVCPESCSFCNQEKEETIPLDTLRSSELNMMNDKNIDELLIRVMADLNSSLSSAPSSTSTTDSSSASVPTSTSLLTTTSVSTSTSVSGTSGYFPPRFPTQTSQSLASPSMDPYRSPGAPQRLMFSGGGIRSERAVAASIRRFRRNFNTPTVMGPPPVPRRRRPRTVYNNTRHEPLPMRQQPTPPQEEQRPDTPQPVHVNDPYCDVETTLFPELYM